MFDHQHTHTRGTGRHRRGDMRDALHGEMGRHLREELRRNLRHGAGHQQFSMGDVFGRGRRGGAVRRGQVRPLILRALEQKPMHGYEVIQDLERSSGGRWRPSAGSIYPTLQQLSDEGLVTSAEVDGRRTYTLTAEGRKAAEESGEPSPWTDADEKSAPDIRQLAMHLVAAVIQVDKMGSPHAQGEATRILTDARKQIYRLLSEDEDEDEDADAAGEDRPA